MAKSLLQITPYALVELDYDTTVISTNTQSFLFFNSSYTNERQLLNVTKGNNPTSNILDRSAVRLTDSRTWAHLDQDRAIPYNSYDSANLSQSLLSDYTSTQWPVEYETLKLHLLSGYNLEDLDGLLLSVEYPEVSGKNCTVAQIAYLKGDEFIKFNARPIVISGRSYDRYIEVLIPSLFSLNDEFYANPTSGALAYWLSSDNKGFLKSGLISITLREITTSSDNGTVLSLTAGDVTNITYKQQDAYSLLSAVIIENDEEDCFEYYPSWQGGFVEDLVSSLNSVGGDYYVFHELYIYEQLGFSQVQSDYFVSIQEGNFNEPKKFRPILKNADSAYSFSIDYVMRLTDKDTGNQIVRTASITSFEPKRHGRKIEKVNLEGSVRSFKIYNKIIEETKLQVNRKVVDKRVEKLYTPTFFDFNEVAVNTSNVILKTDGTFTTESVWNWDVIFGQGEAIMLIHPYENYVKFKMHRYLENNVTTSLDLRYDVDLFLVIEYAGKRVRFSKLEGFYSTNLAEGEIVFKIPAKDSSAIYSNEGGIFYITSKVPSFIKVKVMDNFVGGIANKEINIISKEFYSKGDTDLFELIYDGVTYFVPKNMLQVIQVIPTGSGVSETTLYTGKWRRMQDADTVKDDIEKIRRNELERVLNNIRTSQLSLNTRQSELSQKSSELSALEAKLNAQSSSQNAQADLLNSLQRDVSSKDKINNQRELDLREQARKAAEKENQNIAAFQDQLNKILKSIEDLENVSGEGAGGGEGNQGGGNQGEGNQGGGNQGGGNQGGGNQGEGGGNQGGGNQGGGNQGGGNQGGGNQGGGNQGGGNQGGDNPGGGGIVKTVVTYSDVINSTLGLDRFNPNANITGVARTINYVDFLGRSGSDLGVLPSVGFSPLTIDAGLNFSNKGILVGGGFGTGVPIVNNNSGVNAILGTSGSTVANRRSFSSDSLGTRNGAESNSGVTALPPAGNTEKIVKGRVKNWVQYYGDAYTGWKQFFDFVFIPTGKLEDIKIGMWGNPEKDFDRMFNYFLAISKNEVVELSVESIYYLSVGDFLVSKDEHVKIQITYLGTPNIVRGVYYNTKLDYSTNEILSILNQNKNSIGNYYKYDKYKSGWVLKTAIYDKVNINWDIIKKNSGGGGGGGGEGTGVKQPL